jgi:hypothetical protein
MVLKRTVCQVEHGCCNRCILRQACPYPAVFEGRPSSTASIMRRATAVPQPFVLEVASPGTWDGEPQDLRWGVRLFGEATLWSPYVVESFIRIGVRGIGRRRTPFELTGVYDGILGTPVWSAGMEVLHKPSSKDVVTDRQAGDGVVRWTFHTPLHLREGGQQAGRIDGLGLVIAGRRRWRMLTTLYGSFPVADEMDEPKLDADAFETVDRDLRPWAIGRYSGRQRRRITLSGILGSIAIRGPWSRAGCWMRAVELIHLGKYVTFGFGRVTWRQES